MEAREVELSYRKALLAVIMALLVVGPMLVYPAKALSQPVQEENSILELNAKVTRSVARNLTTEHPYLLTLAKMARAAESLENGDNKQVKAEDVTYNLSKVRIPAVVLSSLDDQDAVIEYAYRYILLKNTFNFNDLNMYYRITWDDNSPVMYNPASPTDSVFGGYFTHRVHFHIDLSQPIVDASPGAGNTQELVELFQQYTHYNVYFMEYLSSGSLMSVNFKKLSDNSEIDVKDYSLYYGVVVQMYYDPQLLQALRSMQPENGTYIYYSIAKVSFTVTLQPSTTQVLAEGSTWQLSEQTYDISPYVVAALNMIAQQIQSSDMPAPVKNAFLQKLTQWAQQSYTLKTKHNIVNITISWVLTDQYDVYENSSYVGGGNEIVLADSFTPSFSVNRTQELIDQALGRANGTLSSYYPGGIKAFLYQEEGQPYPILLYDSETNTTSQMTAGVPSDKVRVDERALLFTTYPLEANTLAGKTPMTKIDIETKTDTTSDYTISPSSLTAAFSYTETATEGNTTYTIHHTYTLYVDISATVKEFEISVEATPYDIYIDIGVEPHIKANETGGLQEISKGHIYPALAPLGGTGIFDLIKGGAGQVGISEIANALQVIDSIVNNTFFQLVFPTYFPTPLIHDSLKIVAPGEYVGVYYMPGKFKIDVPKIGKPLFAIMYEKVRVQLKNTRGNPNADDPSVGLMYYSNGEIQRDGRDYFNMYSLGFAVGEVDNKVIGPRFYMAPSSIGETNLPALFESILNSGLFQFLQGDNFITDLLDDILPGEIFEAAREIIGQMRDNGLYPQIGVYFGGSGSVWPYFLVSPKTTYRFVTSRPGDYLLSANADFYMLHVRIFKIPILGIPIPIPIFESHHESASTTLKVRQIKALPLLINYEIKPPENLNLFTALRAGDPFSSDSYVGIYSVPVWVDLDGYTPIAPVILRGQYGYGPQATSLTIAAVTPSRTVIAATDVYFFGVPLSFVKIPLSELQRITPGEESALLLVPAWKHGKTVSTVQTSGSPTVLRIARVKSFPLFFYDGKLITYTGVYDPDNKIHEYARMAEQKIDEIAGMIQSNLSMVNNTLNNVVGQIGEIQGLLEAINNETLSLDQILQQISAEIVDQIMNAMGGLIEQLVQQFIANAVAAVVGAVVPDPTGFISGYIQDLISQLINNALGQLLPGNGEGGEINITDLITRYGLQVATFLALKAAYNLIGYEGLMNILNEAKSIALKGIEMITRINATINYILKIVNNTVEMTKYKPMVLSALYTYNLAGQQIPNEGILAGLAGASGENIILPIDAIEADLERGGMLYTTPYSTLTFILQIITGAETGEYPNIAVSIPDALAYVAAWVNFVASLLGDNGQSLQQLSTTLLQWSGNVAKYIGLAEQWVEIPGVDTHTILLPTVTLIPPSKI